MESARSGGVDRAIVIQAFLNVRQGFSPDRVVADPDLNGAFLQACRSLGSRSDPAELNRSLLNLRKARELEDHPTRVRTIIRDQDAYRFAAEIAIRFLERQKGISLDDVICSPVLASEFDQLADQVAPGFSSLQYRWAALNLRKKKGLRPELIGRLLRALEVHRVRVSQIDLETVPAQQGVYFFLDSSAQTALYVGETHNLRRRIRTHLEHSDNRGLARWLWEQGQESLWLEYHVLPKDTPPVARGAYEAELVRNRMPLFNSRQIH